MALVGSGHHEVLTFARFRGVRPAEHLQRPFGSPAADGQSAQPVTGFEQTGQGGSGATLVHSGSSGGVHVSSRSVRRRR